MAEKKIVICDIDGTIANNDHRQHFLEGKKDWDGFFSELNKIYQFIQYKKLLIYRTNMSPFITGRPERYLNTDFG